MKNQKQTTFPEHKSLKYTLLTTKDNNIKITPQLFNSCTLKPSDTFLSDAPSLYTKMFRQEVTSPPKDTLPAKVASLFASPFLNS